MVAREKGRSLKASLNIVVIAGLALIMFGLAGFWAYRMLRPPMQYPEGWPLAFVTVPRGAWQHELPLGLCKEGLKLRSWPWGPAFVNDPLHIESRVWEVGFDYPGTLADACRKLEPAMRQRGYLKATMGEAYLDVQDYYSPDFRYQVTVELSPYTDCPYMGPFHEVWPRAWSLKITEYRPPIDFMPVAQQATPIQ